MKAGEALGALLLQLSQRISSSFRYIAAAVASNQTQLLSKLRGQRKRRWHWGQKMVVMAS
jgi:hypothetical protein